MPNFFIIFIFITLIAILVHGVILWRVVRMWNYRPLVHWVRSHYRTIWWIWISSWFLIPIIAIASFIITANHYSWMSSFVYTVSVWALGASGYLLLGSVTSWVFGMIAVLIQLPKKIPQTIHQWLLPFPSVLNNSVKAIITLPLILAGVVIFWGTINSQIIRIVPLSISQATVPVPFPDSWVGKKIVLVSDTHIGQARKKQFLQRVVNNIQSQNPDIVIIAGDLIDGPAFPDHFLEPLGKLRKSSTFFIPGNHEQYSNDPSIGSVIDRFVTRVSDQIIMIDGVQIIGIDYSKKSPEQVRSLIAELDPNPELPTIGVMHDPKNITTLIDRNPNLTLSGHTHGGQMWPGNLLVRYLYGVFTYGPSLHNQTLHITTSGVGTAQSPIRVGTQPEIVVITIVE